jgi:hypothetical protein
MNTTKLQTAADPIRLTLVWKIVSRRAWEETTEQETLCTGGSNA